MKRTLLILISLCITVILQAQVQMIVPRAPRPPVVDGYIDDVEDHWGALIPLTVRNPGGTTFGMTAKFKIFEGDDAFYVAIVVEDATPGNDATAIPNTYERDCSEIFFSLDTVTEPNGTYKAGCWQIRTQREGETLNDGNSGNNTWSVATLLADPMFQVASVSSATEYVQELILPYDVLSDGMDPAWYPRFFRFDIAVSDNTTGSAGGRTEQRYWYGHNGLGDDHGWDNTRSLAIIQFPLMCCGEDPVWEVNPDSISLAAPEGSISTVDIKSSVAWTATSDQKWLKLSPVSGSGNATVTLRAGVNSSRETRNATITITGSGVSSKTITVIQQAGAVGITSQMEENIRIFPNPAKDGFSISGLKDQATICITDLNGRLLLTKQISGRETIPVSSLSSGLYFIKVITDAGTIKKKLVKN